MGREVIRGEIVPRTADQDHSARLPEKRFPRVRVELFQLDKRLNHYNELYGASCNQTERAFDGRDSTHGEKLVEKYSHWNFMWREQRPK